MSTQAKTYLSCTEASRLMGVSRSTAQRYCDQGILRFHRTLGGHRRVLADDVAQWLVQSKRKKQQRPAKPFRTEKFTLGYISQALLDGKLRRLEPLTNQIVLKHRNLTWLFDEFIAPAMWHLGNRWKAGQISYADERRATATLKRLLRGLTLSVGSTPPQRTAVGGSLEGDHAEVGSLMVEMGLRELSYSTFHIGVNLPPATVADVAHDVKASLVWISYCHVNSAAQTIAQNRKLRQSLPESTLLVIGGTALDSGLLAELEFDFYGKTLGELSKFVSSNLLDQ